MRPLLDEKDVIRIGDSRWRKIEDCDKITKGVEKDVAEMKTDVAVVKAILKGILGTALIVAGFIIPACLKIIMGV